MLSKPVVIPRGQQVDGYGAHEGLGVGDQPVVVEDQRGHGGNVPVI